MNGSEAFIDRVSKGKAVVFYLEPLAIKPLQARLAEPFKILVL